MATKSTDESRDEYASNYPNKKGVPPEPAQDPRYGDKTPAWVEWFATNYPEEFKVRFKGRKTHLTKGLNPHLSPPGGDVPESSFGKDPAEQWGIR